MHKRAYLVVFSFLFLQLSFVFSTHAQYLDVTAKPVKGADHISIFTEAGYDAKTCKGAGVERCQAIAWPKRGEPLRVINTLDLRLDGKPKTFLYVEYQRSNGQRVSGYVDAELTTLYDQKNTQAADKCKDCGAQVSNQDEKKQVRELQAALKTLKPKDPVPQVSGVKLSSRYNARCKNFITDEGKLGPWGQLAMKAFDAVDQPFKKEFGQSCFYEAMDVSDVCPNFKNFDMAKKKLFWAYVLASIAQDESSCDPNGRNHSAPNSIADGLFQLEYARHVRAGRDKKFCKTDRAYETTKMDFQLECTASILRDVHCKNNRRLTYHGGYWQELRKYPGKPDRNIVKLIKGFPSCRR